MNVKDLKLFVNKNIIVFDVGSNNGDTAYILHQAFCRSGFIVCFEPNPTLHSTIERRLPFKNKLVVKRAAYHLDGKQVNFRVGNCDQSGTISDWNHLKGELSVYPVNTIRIDTVSNVVGFPDLIKIDCEGAELEALRGAEGTLLGSRPILSMEIAIGTEFMDSKARDLLTYLEGLGYSTILCGLTYHGRSLTVGSMLSMRRWIRFDVSNHTHLADDIVVDVISVPQHLLVDWDELSYADGFLTGRGELAKSSLIAVLISLMPPVMKANLICLKRKFLSLLSR